MVTNLIHRSTLSRLAIGALMPFGSTGMPSYAVDRFGIESQTRLPRWYRPVKDRRSVSRRFLDPLI